MKSVKLFIIKNIKKCKIYNQLYDLIIARGAKSNKIVTTFQSNKKMSPRYIEVINGE